MLVDLGPTGLDGKTAENRLEEVGITVNRNAIPFDERPPMNPSGLRIGTPGADHARPHEDDCGRSPRSSASLSRTVSTPRGTRSPSARSALMERVPALPAALRDAGLVA